MSFEIQELPDVIRIVVLISLSKGQTVQKSYLKKTIDKVCTNLACIDTADLEKALNEMAKEGLINYDDGRVKLTEQGVKLGKEWKSLLMKKEPIMEVVAGLVDGSITGLVVIISAFIAQLSFKAAAFASILALAAVSITNFSSFLLGGITEDLADMMTLENLMHYSLSDIPDGKERQKSLMLIGHLFTVLHKEINKSNIYAATICSTTTFLAGIVPIIAYLTLPTPLDIVLSLTIVAGVVGVFLVRYRTRKTKVHWKITLLETVAIIAIATIVSLIIGGEIA
ncbi:MAG: hypothetical protein QW840_03130 [Candidatus Bathyarchaeia archaeon]